MPKRTRLLLGSLLALAPALVVSAGCTGEVIGGDGGLEGGATCGSVCAIVLACSSHLDPGEGEACTAECEAQQSSCAARGSGSAFQAALDCLAGLSCENPDQFAAMEEGSCGTQVALIEKDCPADVIEPAEASFFDGPFIDVEGLPESEPFDAIAFDVEPFDSGPYDASFDGGEAMAKEPKDAGKGHD
jgi:hypothetical protein